MISIYLKPSHNPSQPSISKDTSKSTISSFRDTVDGTSRTEPEPKPIK